MNRDQVDRNNLRTRRSIWLSFSFRQGQPHDLRRNHFLILALVMPMRASQRSTRSPRNSGAGPDTLQRAWCMLHG